MLDFNNDAAQRRIFFDFSQLIWTKIAEKLKTTYANTDFSYKEKSPGDVVTEVDSEIESVIYEVISSNTLLPKAGFYGEECTSNCDLEADYVWVVDPLDGTNNFAIERPIFGCSIALLHKEIPIFGLLIDPINNDCWMAIRGQGVWRNGFTYTRSTHPDAHQRFIVITGHGYGVLKHSFIAHMLKDANYGFRRPFSSWCPVVDLLLFIKGYANFVLFFQTPIHDIAAALLICEELGYQPMNKIVQHNFLDPVSGVVTSFDEDTAHSIWLSFLHIKIYGFKGC